MNEKFDTTIIMVTHDPVAASYSNRVVMLKDGRIFTEIFQGEDDKQTFTMKLLEHKVYLVA